MLNNPSNEQQNIINQIETNNIIVDAVAGSGKTTTILHIALKYKKLKILVMTYNTKLRLDTLNKIQELQLKNIEIQTYHGFCTKYYQDNCRNDNQIINILNTDINPRKKIKYDMLIIDEAQDMTQLYYELICKIIKNNINIQYLCILGDKNQSIFNFNGADSRYITLANCIFNFNNKQWTKCELNTSYRLTNEMSQFLNNCILNENRIITQKNGSKVKYMICNTFNNNIPNYNYVPFNEIMTYLNTYSRDDIFILGPSVKGNKSPIRNLANKLTECKIEIYVPNNDDEKIDQDIIKNKIVFSSFHQVKGLERKVVLIFGITDNYFKFFEKMQDPNKCPNAIYVALTRATECMTIFHHYQDNFCNFINTENLKLYTDFYEDPVYKLEFKNNKCEPKELAVTELLKHLPNEVINNAKKFLKITEIQKKTTKIDIPVKTKQGKFYENVSEITGTAIPAYFEYINTNKMEICDFLKKHNIISKINPIPKTIPKLLSLANKYCACRSGYDYKLYQINNYDWLSEENLNLAIVRLNNHISKNAVYEKKFEYKNLTLEKNNKKNLCGVIDCIDCNKIWEFKCVSELTDENILQLAIYAFLLYNSDEQKKIFLIREIEEKYNIINYEIKKDDIITFTFNNNILVGSISKLFKNGNINAKVNNKIYKIKKSDITKINIIDDKIEEIKKLNNNYEFYLFNILDNQILKIDSEYNELKKLVEYLIDIKYNNNNIIDDTIFINNALNINNKYSKNII